MEQQFNDMYNDMYAVPISKTFDKETPYSDSVEGFSLALADCNKILVEFRTILQFNKNAVNFNLPLTNLLDIVNSLGFDSQIMLLINLLYIYNHKSENFICSHFPKNVVQTVEFFFARTQNLESAQ
jgi:hypothetical protein